MPRCLISKKLPHLWSQAHRHHPCPEEGEPSASKGESSEERAGAEGHCRDGCHDHPASWCGACPGKALRSAVGAGEYMGRAIPGSDDRTRSAPGGCSAWRHIPTAGQLNRSLATCSARPHLRKLTDKPPERHRQTRWGLGGWLDPPKPKRPRPREPADLDALAYLRTAGGTNTPKAPCNRLLRLDALRAAGVTDCAHRLRSGRPFQPANCCSHSRSRAVSVSRRGTPAPEAGGPVVSAV
jgi:hypothetical protein